MAVHEMRIAAIIAVYNGEAYIGDAVNSLLTQTLPPAEVIVVDDGSNDETPRILEGFGNRITVLRQPNLGQAVSVNSAIASTTSEALAFCDADDLWCSNKLELQVEALRARPDLDAVFGHVRQFLSADLTDNERETFQLNAEVARGEIKQCMLIRRQVFERIGKFDETLPATFFMEWLGRAKRAGMRSDMLDAIVVLRRIHSGNGGRLRKASQDSETLQALLQNIRAGRSQKL